MRDSQTSLRTDIQGLRAIAVVTVVLDHVFGWPHGGFIGVDVFYVISGFLITNILLKEVQDSGRVSFTRFYSRRARRILPAALVVLAATALTSAIVYYRPRAIQILLDGVAALFFVSNWHFVRTGTDYLQETDPPSPLQHYWSLSIEEQFYLFWPWLMLAVALLSARSRRNSRVPLLVVISITCTLSFAAACILTASNPTGAYFNTAARTWELGAGALLATLGTWRLSVKARSRLTWLGVAIIAASAILITPELPFPGPWAGPPVVGTVLVIGACAASNPILDNAVSRWLGEISYSLYLWHFPIAIIGVSLLGESAPVLVVLLLMMLGVAHLSYSWIEQPFRRSRRERRTRVAGGAGAGKKRTIRFDFVAAGALAIVVLSLAAVQLRGPAVVVSADAWLPAPQFSQADPWSSEAEIQGSLTRALSATSWPNLTPSLSQLTRKAGTPQVQSGDTGCRNSVAADQPRGCVYGNADESSKTAVVVGDSIAMSWMSTAVASLVPRGWVLRGLGFSGCPIYQVHLGNVSRSDCDSARQRMLDLIAAEQPDLVLTSSAIQIRRLDSGARGSEAEEEWRLGVAAAVEAIHRVSPRSRIVLIQSPVTGINVGGCATRWTSPERCESRVDEDYDRKTAAESAAVSDTALASVLRTEDWFCVADGRCPFFVDDTPIRFDDLHLTEAFANRVSELFSRRLFDLLGPQTA